MAEVTYQYPFKSKYVLGTLYGVKGTLWKCGYHSGLDLKSKNYGGDGKIYPIAAGVVSSINAHGASYGNHITVRHEDGYESLYAHFASIKVSKWDKVAPDTVLGIEGATGNTTGPHLHLEIHKSGYHYPATINPKIFLDDKTKEAAEVAQIIDVGVKMPSGKVLQVDGIMQGGTNYVAIRQVVEALGYTVGWDGKNVIISK